MRWIDWVTTFIIKNIKNNSYATCSNLALNGTVIKTESKVQIFQRRDKGLKDAFTQ